MKRAHPADRLIVDGMIKPRPIAEVENFDGFESIAQTAARWGTHQRNVTRWCVEGRVPGAFQLGGDIKRPWVIPRSAVKPDVAQGRPKAQQLILVENDESSAERAAPLKQSKP